MHDTILNFVTGYKGMNFMLHLLLPESEGHSNWQRNLGKEYFKIDRVFLSQYLLNINWLLLFLANIFFVNNIFEKKIWYFITIEGVNFMYIIYALIFIGIFDALLYYFAIIIDEVTRINH